MKTNKRRQRRRIANKEERASFKTRLEKVRPYLPPCYGVLVSHHTGLPRMAAYNVINAGTYNSQVLDAMELLFLPKTI